MAILAVGCGEYNKILKSRDPEVMYTKALEYYDNKKYQKAGVLLESIKPYYSTTLRDDTVTYYLASVYYKMGEFDSSSMLFDEFRQNHTNSPFLPDVEYMFAKSFYFMSGPANRDQTATRQALAALDEYMERYPNSPKKDVLESNVQELTQKLYDKAYINAKQYYTIGKYKSAIIALKNALGQYPESNHREELLYLIAMSSYKYADNSFEEHQRERFMDTIDAYYNFAIEYPESQYSKELEKVYKQSQDFIAKYKKTDDEDNEIKDINDIIN